MHWQEHRRKLNLDYKRRREGIPVDRQRKNADGTFKPTPPDVNEKKSRSMKATLALKKFAKAINTPPAQDKVLLGTDIFSGLFTDSE